MSQDLSLDTAKISGAPSRGGWSQIHTWDNLVAALSIKTNLEGVEAVALGREILGRLHEEFFGKPGGSSFARLPAAVGKVAGEYPGLEVAALVKEENRAYTAVVGPAQVWLKRQHQFGLLLRGKDQLQTVSGYLQPGDYLLLCSSRFAQVVSKGTLQAALEGGSLESALELLGPLILGHEGMGEAAGVLVQIRSDSTEADPFAVESLTAPEPRSTSVNLEEPTLRPAAPIFVGRRRPPRWLFGGTVLVLVALLLVSISRRLLFKQAGTAVVSPVEVTSSSRSERDLGELPAFMDLTLLADGVSANALSTSQKELLILSQSKKQLYLLNTEKKSHQVIDLPEGSQLLAADAERLFVWAPAGIYEVSLTDREATLLIEPDQDWDKPIALARFAGNLYLLDEGKSTLWRYPGVGKKFGAKQVWFSDKSELIKPKSLAIDGSIWLITDRSLEKYTLGRKDDFSLKRMPGEFSQPVKVVTQDDWDELYVLDPGLGQVLEIGKDGNYRRSYRSATIKQVLDLVVDKNHRQLYLLTPAKIFSVKLN